MYNLISASFGKIYKKQYTFSFEQEDRKAERSMGLLVDLSGIFIGVILFFAAYRMYKKGRD
ncbi:hypothetical protein [Rossellomorea aquimaris]|uniref:Uncharacterized protein n=1 Tax=Rossellomorea aquimaris TaxID=189382 RepID=A0A5D4U558_9BACI|nr:hypothetical protein [Rossellomorea aquimaris]TYS82331.1 hypothetical protein FZC80_05355 [Rossellomorea aquimaris]